MNYWDILKQQPFFFSQKQRKFYYDTGYLFFPSLVQFDELETLR